MQIKLPEKVNRIITELEAAGYEAYAVGGCIRDSILGKEPDDWDITTSASPMQTKAIFKRTIDTGIQHGTVTVMLDHESFEVTTYRIDGEYEDSRHPKEVIFTKNLVEDLKRRDFTINAMAYNDKSGLVDVFGGIADLENKVVRCVGNAKERFMEDALRMMRAVRFSAQLGFSIDTDTEHAIKELAPNLANISSERIQVELVKLLLSPNPDYIRKAYDLGITAVILPELDTAFETPQNNPHHMYTVGEHLMHCLLNVKADRSLRIAALLHDIGKPASKTTDEDGIDHFHGHVELGEEMAVEILKRLKFDNDTITRVRIYIRHHDDTINPSAKSVRRSMSKIGEEYFHGVLELKRADCLAQSMYMRGEKIDGLERVEALYQEILAKKQCVSLKNLAISGDDLIALGVPQGRKIGEILSKLLAEVIEDPSRNTHEYLLERAKTIAENMSIITKDLEQAKKRDKKIFITDIAISKVPQIKYHGFTDAQNEIMQKLAKEVLVLSKEKNDSNEVAVTCDLGSKNPLENVGVSLGTEHEVDILADTLSNHMIVSGHSVAVVVLHNHPSTQTFSLQDIQFFIIHPMIEIIVVLSNQGTVHYLKRDKEFNYKNAVTLFYECIKGLDKKSPPTEMYMASLSYLAKCSEVGLFYR